jgi:alpha-amylase/alpha-mannosidase (GH57 family)
MHQPLYRLRGETSCFMPWVRLHALRSYYDMVRVLEEFPGARVTINLVPVLLEQIRAYEEGGTDLFWEAAARPAGDLDEGERAFLFDHFFCAHPERMIGELPRFADLFARRERARRLRGPAEAWREFKEADFRDLQALFDLSWFGFKAQEEFPELRSLRHRGGPYTQDNIREIHRIERLVLGRIRPLYREAAAQGRIEISTSPYAHPILPLLIDTEAAREALPRLPALPRLGVPEDARAQVEQALGAVERDVGVRPVGMWPSEGAVSQAVVEMLGSVGVAWAASDEEVLLRSDREGAADASRPWRLGADGGGPAMVFRDHVLSDRIGFSYAGIDPKAAAQGFLAEALSRSRQRGQAEGGLLLIALDGENPWESYPRAGADFLRALYGALSIDPSFRCVTVSEAIASVPRHGTVRRLHAGSWIRADLGTWIGGPEKNRAWTVLAKVRHELAAALRDEGKPRQARDEAWASLRAAEGSDWFWWLDDQFTTAYRAQFDEIFRGHLRQACEAVGHAVPEVLEWPIRSPHLRPGGGELAEPADWLEPGIDGFEGDFFEWHGAVRLSWSTLADHATMQRSTAPVESLQFGFSRSGEFLLRLDPPGAGPRPPFAATSLDLSFRSAESTRRIVLEVGDSGDLLSARLVEESPDGEPAGAGSRPSRARAVSRKILEAAIPLEEAGLPPGSRGGLLIRLRSLREGISLREIDLKVPAVGSAAGTRSAA